MPVVLEEAYESRSANLAKQGKQVQLKFFAHGSGSQIEVEAYALGVIPNFAITAAGDTLVKQQIQTKQIAPTIFTVVVTFGDPDDPKSEDPPQTGDGGMFSFDTTADKKKVTKSISTRMKTFDNGPVFGTAAKGGPIGVADHGKEKKVEGAEIYVPTLKFSRTHYLDLNFVTAEYVKQLSRWTGKMNAGTFQTFEPGEILFAGAIGNRRATNWEVKFDFLGSENIHESDEFWGHELAPATADSGNKHKVEMKGWDHFWVYYRPVKSGLEIVPEAYCGYVEQMYYDFDFALLGIGS